MNDDDSRTRDDIASRVRDFYERHPYPPAADDLATYRASWNDDRRRAESALLWPAQPCRDDRTILVAGCGTVQAAHYAVRWPNAKVVGIDVSAQSLAFAGQLKREHSLVNLDPRQLDVERAVELGESFDHVVCTGVLHHLGDPDAGLRALRSVIAPGGALQVMVYAPFGRAGVYLLQDYCRRLGVVATDDEIHDLTVSMRALPQDHPIVPLLRNSPDFATVAGLADALLHPSDRAFSVPEFLAFLQRARFVFGRWLRQAAYLPACGAVASSPHAARLAAMPPQEQYAAMEVFRGTMVRHSAIAYRDDEGVPDPSRQFETDAWLRFIPLRLPGTIEVRENVPPGSVAVLINRNHSYTDLYLPISAEQEGLLHCIDGKRTIEEIARGSDGALEFFRTLWDWDQIVFCR